MGLKSIFLSSAAGVLWPVVGLAGTAQGVGQGGLIPADPTATSGVTISNAVITGSGVVASGNAITVTLLGLQHDYSGDLIITLSYIDSNGNTVQSTDIVNRVGMGTISPNGTAADFGNNQGAGDNYMFNTDYAGNLWSVAACADPPACTTPLGDADSLPGYSTDAVNGGKYFPSTVGGVKTNLSYAFAGLDVNAGTWRLTINDAATPNIGSFVGWQISIVTTAATQTQSIATYAGTPQSAAVGTSFGSALQAKVTDGTGAAIGGVTVTFAAPTSGASATFGGAASATAVTNASGIAASPVPVANAISGGYTVTASISGVTTSANFALTNTAAVGPSGAASFVGVDTTTLGNWKNSYGGDGEFIPGDSSTPPSYAAVTFNSVQNWIWASSTTNPGALMKYASSGRIASTYYQFPSFSVDVNVTDGKTHAVAVYLDDYDAGGRAEKVNILDGATGSVLDSRTVANFASAPEYLVWNVQGHVQIQAIQVSGANALINGIFFGSSATAAAPPTVSITSPKAGATVAGLVTVTAQAQSALGAPTVSFALDGSALALPVTQSGTSYSVSWPSGTTSNGTHTLTATATDSNGQSTTSSGVSITVANSATSASATFQSLDSKTLGNWKGVYGADGSVIPGDSINPAAYATLTFSNAQTYVWQASTSAPQALVKSGTTDRIASTYYNLPSFGVDISISDGKMHQLALYLDDFDAGSRIETVNILDAGTLALLDTRSVSNFSMNPQYLVWDIQGNVLVQAVDVSGVNALINGIFLDPVAGSTGPPSVSISSPASGATVSGAVTISAQATSSFGIASVQFEVDGNALSGTVTQSASTYSISWPSGTVANGAHTLTAVATDSQGRSTTSASVAVTVANGASTASAVFVTADATTQGNWKGVYGADGEIIPADSSNPPSYATVALNNAQTYTWLGSTTVSKALLKYASATDRIASTYYNLPGFSIDVNITDGNAHQLAIYFDDWDYGSRTETVSVLDAATLAVLNTETMSGFDAFPKYLVWDIKGHVLVQVTQVAGANALVNGIFFAPAK